MIADMRSGGANRDDSGAGFTHRVLFYTGAEEFLATSVPFLHAGLAGDDALLVVTGETNTALLRDALGADAARVDFVDAVDWYRVPTRTLAAYADYVDARPGRRVRIIGEPVWHDRSGTEIREWTRYESLCNAVFSGSPVSCLCPYDVSALGHEILANALRTHPEQAIDTAGVPNRLYTDPVDLALETQRRESAPPPIPASVPTAPPTVVDFGPRELGELRQLISEHARRAGMRPERITELIVLVNEVADDAFERGDGRGVLRMWSTGDQLVCELTSPTSQALAPGGPLKAARRAARHVLRAALGGSRGVSRHDSGPDSRPTGDEPCWDRPG